MRSKAHGEDLVSCSYFCLRLEGYLPNNNRLYRILKSHKSPCFQQRVLPLPQSGSLKFVLNASNFPLIKKIHAHTATHREKAEIVDCYTLCKQPIYCSKLLNKTAVTFILSNSHNCENCRNVGGGMADVAKHSHPWESVQSLKTLTTL